MKNKYIFGLLLWQVTASLAAGNRFAGNSIPSRISRDILPGVREMHNRGRLPSSRLNFEEPSPGAIFFPGDTLPTPFDANSVELPEDLDELSTTNLQRLNELNDVEDFVKFFGFKPNETDNVDTIGLRFGGNATKLIKNAKQANCQPELQTVSLNVPTELNTLYFPSCVRLERCGGCCYGSSLSCQPIETVAVQFKVVKVVTSRAATPTRRRRRRHNSEKYVIVDDVRHTKCECGCKVQEKNCNEQLHTYNKAECACQCKNRDEQSKCQPLNSTHYWDNESCQCFCRKTQDCSTGEHFNHATCRCEINLKRSAEGAIDG